MTSAPVAGQWTPAHRVGDECPRAYPPFGMTEPRLQPDRRIDDDIGGDPPCWAHLFEHDDPATSDAEPPELVEKPD